MSDWRISRSGYSIVTGQGDERRIIASMPATVPKEVIQPWLEAAMALVDLQASLQAENARLTSEVARLDDLVRRAIANATGANGKPAWACITDTFALGSTRSRELCRQFGIDPEQIIGPGKHIGYAALAKP